VSFTDIFDLILLRLAFALLVKLILIRIDYIYYKKKFVMKHALSLAIYSSDIQEISFYIIFCTTSTLIRLHLLYNEDMFVKDNKLTISSKDNYFAYSLFVISSIFLSMIKKSINLKLNSYINLKAVNLPVLATLGIDKDTHEVFDINKLDRGMIDTMEACTKIMEDTKLNNGDKIESYLTAKYVFLNTESYIYTQLQKHIALNNLSIVDYYYTGAKFKEFLRYGANSIDKRTAAKSWPSTEALSGHVFFWNTNYSGSFEEMKLETSQKSNIIRQLMARKANEFNVERIKSICDEVDRKTNEYIPQFNQNRIDYQINQNNLSHRIRTGKIFVNLLSDCLYLNFKVNKTLVDILNTEEAQSRPMIETFKRLKVYIDFKNLLNEVDNPELRDNYRNYLGRQIYMELLLQKEQSYGNDSAIMTPSLNVLRNKAKAMDTKIDRYIQD
jgi:hypothetical protein